MGILKKLFKLVFKLVIGPTHFKSFKKKGDKVIVEKAVVDRSAGFAVGLTVGVLVTCALVYKQHQSAKKYVEIGKAIGSRKA